MKTLKMVLIEYLKKKLVDDLDANNGEPDIFECESNPNLFFEDVVGQWWFICKVPNFDDEIHSEEIDFFDYKFYTHKLGEIEENYIIRECDGVCENVSYKNHPYSKLFKKV